MATDALYYPWIDPTSKTMLINSLLYWDNLHTIVPAEVKIPFRNQWTKAAHDYGFLKSRVVEPWCREVYQASDEFADDLERSAIEEGVHLVKDKATALWPHGYPIYPGKLSPRLRPENLTPHWRRRIWRYDKPDEDGCFRMTGGYALPYMSRLASVIAENDKLTPYTDQRWGRDIVIDRYADLMQRDPVSENETRLAQLSINTIKIQSHVVLADVIRFRDDNHDKLKRYRKAIHALALQVSGAGSDKHQDREIQRIVKDVFEPAHEDLGAKLRDNGVDFGTNLLQVSVTGTGAGVGALVGGGLGAMAGALVGTGIGVTFSYVRWRIARNRLEREPMAYLVELRKRFHE